MERGCASTANENRKPIEQDKVPSQQVVGTRGLMDVARGERRGAVWSGCLIDCPVAIFIHLGSVAPAVDGAGINKWPLKYS